jgi:hypothetical protein
MHIFQNVRRVALVALPCATLLAACNSGGDDDGNVIVDPPVATVKLTAPRDTLHVLGDSLQLSAADGTGHALAATSVTWSSSNAAVLTVAADGKARAVSQGSAWIVGRWNGAADSVSLSVKQVVKTVTMTPADTAVKVGATYRLTVTARDSGGSAVPSATTAFASNNASIADVAADGTVTARGVGTVGLRATAGGVSNFAYARVSSPTIGDADDPVLTAVTITPATIHASAADSVATLAMAVTDASSGVQSAALILGKDGSTFGFSCTVQSPTKGEARNGTFACSIGASRLQGAGTYFIQRVEVTDFANHKVTYDQAAVATRGTSTFTVQP